MKIIIADISHFHRDMEHVSTQIAPCYMQKYHRHKIQKDKQQELVSGLLLKQYLGVTEDEQLVYSEYGKPYLASGSMYFNLTHSEDYVALAIGDCEVGIDMEKTMDCHEATVKKVFNKKQKDMLARYHGRERDECFTKIWTECESVLKLKGTGFANGWKEIPVDGCHLFTMKYNGYYLSCATEDHAFYRHFRENCSGIHLFETL